MLAGQDSKRNPLQNFPATWIDTARLSPAFSVGLLCHLFGLFYSHATRPLRHVVPASYLLPAIDAGHDLRPLVLVICANSAIFSDRLVLDAPIATDSDFHGHLVAAALSLLDLGETYQLVQAMTWCVLIEYEISQSSGRRAWMHTGKIHGHSVQI